MRCSVSRLPGPAIRVDQRVDLADGVHRLCGRRLVRDDDLELVLDEGEHLDERQGVDEPGRDERGVRLEDLPGVLRELRLDEGRQTGLAGLRHDEAWRYHAVAEGVN